MSFGPPKELLLDLNRDLIQPPFSPLCPFLMVAGMDLKYSFDLQRREAEQIAGASFLELAGNLPRHQQRPDEAAPKWPGLPGQVDRQLLAWRSVLVRTERLPQLHRLRDHYPPYVTGNAGKLNIFRALKQFGVCG
jgi:hypothetical protein